MTNYPRKISTLSVGAAVRVATLVLLLAVCGAGAARAQTLAYVTSDYGSDVAVIDTTTNTVTATIPVGSATANVAVAPNGARAYVTKYGGDVAVIDTATNTVITNVTLASSPYGVAVTPNGAFVYVTGGNAFGGEVSVIDTSTNAVTATIPIGGNALGIAITPDVARASAANAIRTNLGC